MYVRYALSGSILALLGLAACGVLEPEGWQSTRWGMTERDVCRVLARFSPGRCPDDFGHDAKLCIDRYLIEKRVYAVSFHFDETTKGLYSVSIRSGDEDEEFMQLILAGLVQKFGNNTSCLPATSQDSNQKRKLDICYQWSESRNIIYFRKYSEKPTDSAQVDWHIITYSRGPITIIDRL
jgi:hypothetical protein